MDIFGGILLHKIGDGRNPFKKEKEKEMQKAERCRRKSYPRQLRRRLSCGGGGIGGRSSGGHPAGGCASLSIPRKTREREKE